ncbi:MAG: polyprenyl synthetase family protein [Candidatus Micrarchaeia archaeon]
MKREHALNLWRKATGVVEEELGQVEKALHGALEDVRHIPVIDWLADSRGKQARGALALLSCGACGGFASNALDVAVAVELAHQATLLHDDVIDDAERRRGRESANARFGSKKAVVAGDFLLAKAMEIIVGAKNEELAAAFVQAGERTCLGELEGNERKAELELGAREYERIAEKKTGAFFSFACEGGAIAAGAGAVERTAVREFGVRAGIAFQLSDDALDYAGEGGEDAGRRVTMPFILALQKAGAGGRKEVAREWAAGNARAIAEFVVANNGVAEALELAAAHATAAKKSLGVLRSTHYRDALEAFCDWIVERKS